jgi:hypothetical protein
MAPPCSTKREQLIEMKEGLLMKSHQQHYDRDWHWKFFEWREALGAVAIP